MSRDRRSENMRRIKSKGMKPELFIRKLVHKLGYRFRLHRKDLPGKPDLVFAPRKKVIQVHGCFWHGHGAKNCPDLRPVKSNTQYWNPKIAGNKARDERQLKELRKLGWQALVLWECEINKRKEGMAARIIKFLGKLH
ncbi:MAG TPA: very short patch repair endonuclease [Xanthobacteraceae bacterium]|nr:very short patch repair endonuclease [Xanthobacteraceae bacterium]